MCGIFCCWVGERLLVGGELKALRSTPCFTFACEFKVKFYFSSTNKADG